MFNSKAKNWATALLMASQNGHENIVEMLLNHDADVNIRNNNGATVLEAAKYGKNQNIIEMLIEAGAK